MVFHDVYMHLHFFFLVLLRPPLSPLFPYTTLFRSRHRHAARLGGGTPARESAALVHRWRDAREHRLVLYARLRSVQNQTIDRKSTRLNSSHTVISYAVFCLKKKT